MDYMIERLKAMKVRLADIDNILMQGTSDIKTMTKLSKERATLEEPVDMYNKLLRMEQDQSDAFEMMKDSDLKKRMCLHADPSPSGQVLQGE